MLWLDLCTTTQNNDLCSSVRGDSKFEMVDGKHPLDVRGGGDQWPGR